MISISTCLFSQPNTTIDLSNDKPKIYEKRRLKSEKTGEKKFTVLKHTFTNTVSQYNYFFNATNRLNEMLAKAKLASKDDYTKLLSFYNYNLETTSKSKSDLDSVIYKCTAGILLHDLRSDWVDDMYLLLGKAYLFRKDFDSAFRVFQYINYIYAPKDDGYDIPIGSNVSNTNGIFTVATVEKRNLAKRLTTFPPRRNDCFIWMIRNYLEQDKLPEASGLISIIQTDPQFPNRLHTDLEEMKAYYFYKSQVYDSAAWHLEKAIENAFDKSEKARWCYLCGQLYQLGRNHTAAIGMFDKAISYTSDPFMDVYARLNMVKLTASITKGDALQNNLDELHKMAKRDKYESYRDIIYYAAGVLEIQQKNIPSAEKDLLKSIKFSSDNSEQKQKSFLLLAQLNYDLKSYLKAYNFYDSLQTDQLPTEEKETATARKVALQTIVLNLENIHEQDSLQALANMTYEQRVLAVKKLYKRLMKEKGLKANVDIDFGSAADFGNSPTTGGSLFGNSGNAASGSSSEPYFENASLKSQGYKDFKIKWGNRPNADNWRRQSDLEKNINRMSPGFLGSPDMVNDVPQLGDKKEKDEKSNELTFEGMLLNIPVTQEKKDSSNKIIINALMSNGDTFKDKLEEYPSAIEQYEEILHRFPNSNRGDEALFNLTYCYKKVGFFTKADSASKAISTNYSTGKYATILKDGTLRPHENEATRKYEAIYDLFVEGNYETAKAEKQKADSIFGKSYWTPQLLYIESIYYIKKKDDNTALKKLQNIIDSFASNSLAEKAKNMMQVIRRRSEIESYLTKLDIEVVDDSLNKRYEFDSARITVPLGISVNQNITNVIIKDARMKYLASSLGQSSAVSKDGYTFNLEDPCYVIASLQRVDGVFVNEAKNAFTRFNANRLNSEQIVETSLSKYDDETNFIIIGTFENVNAAITYYDKTRPVTSSKIVPWLAASKYSMFIVSKKNYDVLTTKKDLAGYILFLKNIYPDKF